MADYPERTYQFLSRAYQVVKVLAVTSVSIAGVLVSIVALDIKISSSWWQVKVPLFAFAAVATALVLLYGVTVVVLGLLLKDALSTLSFFRNLSKNLKASVSRLEGIAYNDPITGIGNSHALQREILKGNEAGYLGRCLILLDLQNFGEINKKYNHWKGDEYLRNFAHKVTTGTRRDEFLFKKRPISAATEETDEGTRVEVDDVKAFRRNSGGDEFFVLLQGTIVDGLGYLTRLQKRQGEFEEMSMQLLGAKHIFGFHAGLVAVGKDESYESVNKRVSECLGLALDKDSPLLLYWNPKELPELAAGSIGRRIVDDATLLFRKAD
ncbi:MAG: GGDEF domain-containing protein [Deltaproteobacteria bacterium]|nr:GGDEF domain-containing protein [Deltaproteobacteria bacterium]